MNFAFSIAWKKLFPPFPGPVSSWKENAQVSLSHHGSSTLRRAHVASSIVRCPSNQDALSLVCLRPLNIPSPYNREVSFFVEPILNPSISSRLSFRPSFSWERQLFSSSTLLSCISVDAIREVVLGCWPMLEHYKTCSIFWSYKPCILYYCTGQLLPIVRNLPLYRLHRRCHRCLLCFLHLERFLYLVQVLYLLCFLQLEQFLCLLRVPYLLCFLLLFLQVQQLQLVEPVQAALQVLRLQSRLPVSFFLARPMWLCMLHNIFGSWRSSRFCCYNILLRPISCKR